MAWNQVRRGRMRAKIPSGRRRPLDSCYLFQTISTVFCFVFLPFSDLDLFCSFLFLSLNLEFTMNVME